MNILQVITPARVAGAERSTLSLCEHLQRAGHGVVVACKAGSELIPLLEQAGLEVCPLPLSGKLNLRAAPLLARLARRTGSAVIHTHLSSAAWHGSLAARLARIPAVAHVRALNSPHWYRGARRVIAVSHAVKQHLAARGLREGRIDVVYNGVDPARYYLPCTREEARLRAGLPTDGVLVGVVAHLTPRKGHAVFLEAFGRIAPRFPGCRAIFLGEGTEMQVRTIRDQAARLGLSPRLILAGFHLDVLPYYAAFDIVVLPSVAGEGLPRALLEGGLMGRPAIASNLSGAPEIVRDGETGFITPVGDVACLADRLELLVADGALRERMGRAARDFVGSTFTVEAMVRGTLASYERAGAAVHQAR